MAINENLQNAVEGLKTAKESIATALKNKEQEVADNDGFGTFAGKINNLKPSSYQDVSKVTATKDDVLSGKKFVDSNGELTPGAITTQAAKTITPSTSTQTAVAANVYTTGAVTVNPIPSTYVKPSYTKTATTYTPTTTNQTIAAKTYCSGTQTIKGDTNLKAENIKSGVSIFGVSGTLANKIEQRKWIISSETNEGITLNLNDEYVSKCFRPMRTTSVDASEHGFAIGVTFSMTASSYYTDFSACLGINRYPGTVWVIKSGNSTQTMYNGEITQIGSTLTYTGGMIDFGYTSVSGMQTSSIQNWWNQVQFTGSKLYISSGSGFFPMGEALLTIYYFTEWGGSILAL